MIYGGWSKMTRFEKACFVIGPVAALTGMFIWFYVRRETPWREPAAYFLYALAWLAAAGEVRRKSRTEALILLLGAVGWAIWVCITKL